MFIGKVIVRFALLVVVFAAARARVRAQSQAEAIDPAARALQKIETLVERRASIADRVMVASKLLDETSTTRMQGERMRAEATLKQAEALLAELSPSEQSHLLEKLSSVIAAEWAALNPGPPEKQPTILTGTPPMRGQIRNAVARSDQNTLGRILREEGIPVELLAVAFVESRFNPLALSPKGARGIWQLMPATAARYGLRVEPRNDHRTHPEHSTRAAARYLRDLYEQFGDWKLALAAYNWGEGNVQRVIARTGLHDFGEMARRGLLPMETRKYVPAVLAAWSELSGFAAGMK